KHLRLTGCSFRERAFNSVRFSTPCFAAGHPAHLRMPSTSASESASQPPLEVLMMVPNFHWDGSISRISAAEILRDINKDVEYSQSSGSCTIRAQTARRSGGMCTLLSRELKRNKPARQKAEDFHHNVYVVLLNDAVAKHPSILRLNPTRDPLKPCVYV